MHLVTLLLRVEFQAVKSHVKDLDTLEIYWYLDRTLLQQDVYSTNKSSTVDNLYTLLQSLGQD